MFKSKLQELCQQKKESLPIYCQASTGPPHNPRFKAEVEVAGNVYNSHRECKSSKEAQNQAARMAIDALTTPDQALHAITIPGPATVAGDAKSHLYKNQLLTYAQQKKRGVPTYEVQNFGPKHDQRFKVAVSIDGKMFDHPGSFTTKKGAQHAAAKIALRSLSMQTDVCKAQLKVDRKVSVRRQPTSVLRVDVEAKVDAEDQGYLLPRDKRAASRDQKRNKDTKL